MTIEYRARYFLPNSDNEHSIIIRVPVNAVDKWGAAQELAQEEVGKIGGLLIGAELTSTGEEQLAALTFVDTSRGRVSVGDCLRLNEGDKCRVVGVSQFAAVHLQRPSPIVVTEDTQGRRLLTVIEAYIDGGGEIVKT